MKTLQSLWRGLPRILLLAALAVVNLHLSNEFPLLLGPVLTPIAYGFSICLFGLAGGDLALRILQPHVSTSLAAEQGIQGNTGAAIVYLGRCILAAVVLMLVVTAARAAEPPAAAVALLPVLKAEQDRLWPDMPMASALGAQVEQETCTSLTSRSCWNPRAELRTSREQGVGLGQLTRAFRADGSTRFDALAEIVKDHPRELQGLSWENRLDPVLQLRALVLKDLQGYTNVRAARTDADRLAMTFAAYNGGPGGLSSDRAACAGTPGCDPGRWFGHVENTSLKAKAAVPGYGASFYCVNRTYVFNVIQARRARYVSLDDDRKELPLYPSPSRYGCKSSA